MNDLQKEFLREMEEELEDDNFMQKMEKKENRLRFYDTYGRWREYTWENELYQKLKDFPEVSYTYKVVWNDGDVDYFIANKHEVIIWVRVQKDRKIRYTANDPEKYPNLIKNLYEILKGFVEGKKEYRIRITMGFIEIEKDEMLEEILEVEVING